MSESPTPKSKCKNPDYSFEFQVLLFILAVALFAGEPDLIDALIHYLMKG